MTRQHAHSDSMARWSTVCGEFSENAACGDNELLVGQYVCTYVRAPVTEPLST